MKVIPVSSPAAIAPQGTPESVRTAKAVAAFNKGASSYDKVPTPTVHEHPVANPNKISPEELSAVQTPGTSDKISKDVAASEETETPITPKVEEQGPELTKQFERLARQERTHRAKIQQQEQTLKAREAALAEREAALTAKDTQYKTEYISVEEFKADPLAVMARTGLSYDQLTEQLLNPIPRDPRMETLLAKQDAKIKALEEAQEQGKKTYQEQQDAQYQQAVKQITDDAKALVKADPVAFEAIAKTGSVKDVVELITQTFDKDGVLLTVEEAAQQVEEYLVEESFKTLSKIDKLRKRMQTNAQSETSPAKTEQTISKQPQTMKTLTNASSSQRQLSAKERAILAFKGELKS